MVKSKKGVIMRIGMNADRINSEDHFTLANRGPIRECLEGSIAEKRGLCHHVR